jgi:hypothetical protein
MASAEKRLTTPDAATLALWRVAEHGDVAELNDVLPRVPDINACNEHGVTALMRAAQNGRVKMVRALLEHGADANIKRNDKFTALALAAFFGHTDVVRTLMEHGADLKASTRSGTSPQMWATARTFSEVVNQLEKTQAPQPEPVVKPLAVVKETPASRVVSAMRVAAAAPAVRQGPQVVRTLKDPPEIWDLVHEAPRTFDPRSAFVNRLKSMKTGFAFRAATAVVLIGMCVVGVLVLRGVQARSERTIEPQASGVSQPVVTAEPINSSQPTRTAQPDNAGQVASEAGAITTSVDGVTEPGAASATGAATATGAAAEAETKPVAPSLAETGRPFVSRRFGSARVVSSHRVERGSPRVVATEAAEPVATPAEKPAPRVEVSAKPKTNVPLSPQLITPAKSPTTKSKVIQWP